MPINASSTSLMSVGGPDVLPVVSFATTRTEPTPSTVQDLAQLLASSPKDHLAEWKLPQYNGDLLQWHEWFGPFKSAIDSTLLTVDVKSTYLKTQVTGNATMAMSEILTAQRCTKTL